jgi:hypothetical protein
MHLNAAALALFLTAYFYTSPTLLRVDAFPYRWHCHFFYSDPCHLLEKAEPFRKKRDMLLLRTHHLSSPQPLHCTVHRADYHSRHRWYHPEAPDTNCLETGATSISKFMMRPAMRDMTRNSGLQVCLRSYMNWRIPSFGGTQAPAGWCWPH